LQYTQCAPSRRDLGITLRMTDMATRFQAAIALVESERFA
jgi:hypothetical protein